MEDRQNRLLLVIILTFITWYLVSSVFNPPKKVERTTQNQTKTDSSKDKELNKDVTPKIEDKTDSSKNTTLKEVKPEEITKHSVITSSFLVKFTSLGGRIEKFYIKNYNDLDGKEVKIAKTEEQTIEFDGQKYKAIEVSRERGFDFNLIDSKKDIPLSKYNRVNFSSKYDESTNTLTYEAPSEDGKYTLRKIYRFFKEENYFTFQMDFVNATAENVVVANPSNLQYFRSFSSLGPMADGPMGDRQSMNYFRFYYMDNSFKDYIDGKTTEGFFSSMFGSKNPEEKTFEVVSNPQNGLDFAGTGSRYFVAVLDPLEHKPSSVLLDNRDGNVTGVIAVYDNISLKPNETFSLRYANYVGIREADAILFRNKSNYPIEATSPFNGLSEKLDKSFNQGMTTPFRNAIVWLLKKMYLLIPNYGWCIIVFGIAFKIVFYPLNKKQAESMKKMQELKPQIDALNEKYTDPQVRQQKIVDLYRTNNANPMGGCLPMIIQIPIFIALYTAFSDTIDVWKETFLWVKDLAEPDTVYKLSLLGMDISLNILPLVMVATQIVQTQMTAVSSDPNQKMMMYMMPLIMLYFFWAMPSGVTLYWTIQNILSIAQQVYTNKYAKTPPNKVTTVVDMSKVPDLPPKKKK